ncbi:MAG TPA: hypothetical protein VIC58_03675 [Actinomycetota bacterium]
MRRLVAAVLGTLLVVVLAMTLPATADPTSLGDGNDAGGRLDVQTLRFDPDTRPVTWRFVTFARWTPHQIWDDGFLIVQLDTKGNEGIDYLAVVGSDGRDLVGTLFRVRSDGRQVEIGSIGADKDGPRAARVSLALHRLSFGPNRTTYLWSALTSFTGHGCERPCFDVVPDAGMVEQPLPGTSPSPSPSPSG